MAVIAVCGPVVKSLWLGRLSVPAVPTLVSRLFLLSSINAFGIPCGAWPEAFAGPLVIAANGIAFSFFNSFF
jgi:hypothetical protein